MGSNQNTWSHRPKIIFHEINILFHPLGSLVGFPARVIVLWQENTRGTRNASLASDRYNVVVDVVFKCLRQRSKYVCQQYFSCMCFLGFIRYNNTFIACGFRKCFIFPSPACNKYNMRWWYVETPGYSTPKRPHLGIIMWKLKYYPFDTFSLKRLYNRQL